MKNLSKFMEIIDRLLRLVWGDGVDTAGSSTYPIFRLVPSILSTR